MSSVAKAKRPMSAGRAKKVAKNSLVHIILGILAVVWLFPIFWIIMTSFRAESGAYTKYFFPHSLTFSNYTRLFTETTLLNFPRAFFNTLFKYTVYISVLMHHFNSICTFCCVLYVTTEI